ncbi:MAG: hypothetical protein QCI38_08945, partial [Candidatus Thermoplasmatota archaeon]|nr:hypothetical protein [Candidatus Thermoplasmatota archaeon]
LAISAFPSLVLERLVDPAVNALVPIPAMGAAGTSAAALTQNVNTGAGTYNVLILLLALSLCVLFTLWLRSMGPAKHAKRKHVGEAYYFGNTVTASARVAGSNVYWGFMKAMDKYYKPVVAEHTGSANDYVSWLTLTGAAILIVVVFL